MTFATLVSKGGSVRDVGLRVTSTKLNFCWGPLLPLKKVADFPTRVIRANNVTGTVYQVSLLAS